MVTIQVELTENEALAFAQFLKRATLSDYRDGAANEEESFLMQHAGESIRKALAESGFAPR